MNEKDVNKDTNSIDTRNTLAVIEELKHTVKTLSGRYEKVENEIAENREKISDFEKKLALFEQKMSSTESMISMKLHEIKASLENLKRDYDDLTKNLSTIIRDEVKVHLDKMDTYNKDNFERLQNDVEDLKSDMKKILFSIVGIIGAAFLNILVTLLISHLK